MLKKSLAFGLLAASLMVAPGAAFAQSQSQVNDQLTDQSGAALDGSVNVQNSRSNNRQKQKRMPIKQSMPRREQRGEPRGIVPVKLPAFLPVAEDYPTPIDTAPRETLENN